jgi:pre-mRNA-splicing regulator WTAP
VVAEDVLGGAQTENEDMGREMAEGKMHAIEQQAALARSYAEDMRKLYTELEEHTTALDEEAGALNTQV